MLVHGSQPPRPADSTITTSKHAQSHINTPHRNSSSSHQQTAITSPHLAHKAQLAAPHVQSSLALPHPVATAS